MLRVLLGLVTFFVVLAAGLLAAGLLAAGFGLEPSLVRPSSPLPILAELVGLDGRSDFCSPDTPDLVLSL